METEWEKIKRRFEEKREIKLSLIFLWRRVKLFINPLIACLFAIFAFRVGYGVIKTFFFDFYEKIRQTLDWIEIIFISSLFGIFAIYAIVLILTLILKRGKLHIKIKKIYGKIKDLIKETIKGWITKTIKDRIDKAIYWLYEKLKRLCKKRKIKEFGENQIQEDSAKMV